MAELDGSDHESKCVNIGGLADLNHFLYPLLIIVINIVIKLNTP